MSLDIIAPMPGKINEIVVEVGAQVSEEQELLIMESMKMEIPIKAPKAGKIQQILVSRGDSVDKDMVIATIE